jgi:hypothetical protein
MLATEGPVEQTQTLTELRVQVVAVAAVVAAVEALAVAALASWVRALAAQVAMRAALLLELAAAAGRVVHPEPQPLADFTVVELAWMVLQVQARVAAAPSVLFGPAQTYPLARSHQQTQGMYK